MSNLESTREIACPGAEPAGDSVFEILEPRGVPLGPHQIVQRVLPNRDRRTIGAWCFVNHYGPEDVRSGRGMWVPPHPHSGLQTVSWLLSGEIRHRDSLGTDALVRPGELDLMIAGAAIAHSEATPAGSVEPLHGVQLWVALPDPARLTAAPAFAQHRDLTDLRLPGLSARVIVGEIGEAELPLRRDFEYGALAVDGDLALEGHVLERSRICYLGTRRESLRLSGPGRGLLLGCKPFAEQLVIWWNFIGRSHDEIVAIREEWNSPDGGRFGVVRGFDGDRLVAPPMPTIRLKPRGRSR